MTISVVSAQVGWGTLGVNELGYPCPGTQGRIVVLGAEPWHWALSAHAPSEVVIRTDTPCAIVAAANASFNCPVPVHAWINYHLIGTITKSSERSPAIHVPPGEYCLRMETAQIYCAHTVWLFYPSVSGTRQRVALVTIGAYSCDALPETLQMLFRSAAVRGLLVHVLQVGERYVNHYHNKVVRLYEDLQKLPEAYEFVVYIDGNDSFVLGTELELRTILEEVGAPLVGTEDCCWPLPDDGFRNRFLEGTHRFLNAGCWGGKRERVISVLESLPRVREDIRCGAIRLPGVQSVRLTNDQLVWQVAYVEKRIDVVLDTEWQFVANLPCSWMWPTPNQFFQIDGKRIRVGQGHTPPIVHLPGKGKRKKHLWWGLIEP